MKIVCACQGPKVLINIKSPLLHALDANNSNYERAPKARARNFCGFPFINNGNKANFLFHGSRQPKSINHESRKH